MSQSKKALACPKLTQWSRLRGSDNCLRTSEKAATNGYPHRVRQTKAALRIPALIWCMENIRDEYTFIPSIDREHSEMGTTFFFRDPLDATAFKLVWG